MTYDPNEARDEKGQWTGDGAVSAERNVMPTRKRDWVKAGDRCVQPNSGWTGTVISVHDRHSIPVAKVKWDHNGHTGTMTITMLRKASSEIIKVKSPALQVLNSKPFVLVQVAPDGSTQEGGAYANKAAAGRQANRNKRDAERDGERIVFHNGKRYAAREISYRVEPRKRK